MMPGWEATLLDPTVAGSAADPLPGLLERYRDRSTVYKNVRYPTVAARKVAYEALWALEKDLAATEPRTLRGALAQLEFALAHVSDDERLHAEQRRAMETAIGFIRRLADAA
jgi:hypothetical protein